MRPTTDNGVPLEILDAFNTSLLHPGVPGWVMTTFWAMTDWPFDPPGHGRSRPICGFVGGNLGVNEPVGWPECSPMAMLPGIRLLPPARFTFIVCYDKMNLSV
jgi:hypothetical protein